jgi:hypothetical protein
MLPSIDKQMTSIDKQMTSIDKQMTSIDKQMTSIDKQMTSIDKQMTSIDKQILPDILLITEVESHLHKMFHDIDGIQEVSARYKRLIYRVLANSSPIPQHDVILLKSTGKSYICSQLEIIIACISIYLKMEDDYSLHTCDLMEYFISPGISYRYQDIDWKFIGNYLEPCIIASHWQYLEILW